jgi:hypothetical protein
MFGIDTLFFLIAPFAVPFLVGWKVRSTKRGLIPLMVIPVLFGLGSACLIFFGDGTSTVEQDPYLVLAAALLAGAAIYLSIVFTVSWLIGRAYRRRRNSTGAPKNPPAKRRASNTPAIDTRVGASPPGPGSAAPVDVPSGGDVWIIGHEV